MDRLGIARKLSLALAGLMAMQAILGIVFSGEYRDVEWIAATWWGNDWVTLVLGVPLLLAGLLLASRSSTRGLLLWAGMLAYAAYNYAYYLLGAALNRFFALYIACVVVAVAGLLVLMSSVDHAEIADRLRSRAPIQALGGYFIFVAVGLSVVWLGTWAAYAFAGRATPVETEAFKLVAALDTTLMVPALATAGYLLVRRRASGPLVAGLAGVQAALYLLVLSVNSLVAIDRGLVEPPGELPIWGTLLTTTAVAVIVLFASVDPRSSASSSQR